MFSFTKTGDWEKAGIMLNNLTYKLFPYMKARMDEHGEWVLERLKDHISAQDLKWESLAEHTVRLKGHSDIYVETGFLRDNLKAVKVTDEKNKVSIFIGATPDVKHPTGLSLSDLMIYLEYGTHAIPPRPLLRPTQEELKSLLVEEVFQDLINFIKGGA